MSPTGGTRAGEERGDERVRASCSRSEGTAHGSLDAPAYDGSPFTWGVTPVTAAWAAPLGAAMALHASRGAVAELPSTRSQSTPSPSSSPHRQRHTSAPHCGHGTRFSGGGDACHAGIESHSCPVALPLPPPRASLDTRTRVAQQGVGARQGRAAGMGPPATPPGFIDGKLQESCPFTTDEAAVYASLCRLVPPAAYGRADFVLKLACVRGYHKEKPRAETTAAELTRILDWREKNRMDEVRVVWSAAVRRGRGRRENSRLPQPLRLPWRAVEAARHVAGGSCAPRHVLRATTAVLRGAAARRWGARPASLPRRQCQLQPLTPALLPTAAAAAHTSPRGRLPQVLAHAGARGGRLRALRRPRTNRGASLLAGAHAVTRRAPLCRCLTHIDVH